MHAPAGSARAAGGGAPNAGASKTFPFRAELDIAELDERHRPAQSWTARGVELSRSALTFKSRRLCYQGRELLVGVHLVDDRPVVLFGVVTKSDYEGEGLYHTTINLRTMPDNEAVQSWGASLPNRSR